VRVRGKDRRTNKRELRNGKNTGDSVKIRSRTVAKTCASQGEVKHRRERSRRRVRGGNPLCEREAEEHGVLPSNPSFLTSIDIFNIIKTNFVDLVASIMKQTPDRCNLRQRVVDVFDIKYKRIHMKQSIFGVLLLLVSACTHIPPPPDAVPGRIAVVADTKSPYWGSMINNYVPKGINDYAHYPIVDGSKDAPYKLVVRILSADSYISGFIGGEYSTTAMYRTKVEVEAELLDQNYRSVWSWSGWANYDSGARAVWAIAKLIGKEMAAKGLLVPSYYTVNSENSNNDRTPLSNGQ